VRKSQLAREPLCFDPFSDHERRGVTATAMQVHHIRPLTTHPELAFHGSNLMSVCTACHAKLSVEERNQS
jgi:5-methylcytosine-specific restriction endonuclease McrA